MKARKRRGEPLAQACGIALVARDLVRRVGELTQARGAKSSNIFSHGIGTCLAILTTVD